MRLAVLLAATAVGSLGLSACSSQHLTQAQYVAKAEAICASVEQQGQGLPAPSGPADLPAFLTHSLTVTQDGLTRLNRLTNGYQDKAWVDRVFLTPLQGRLDAVRAAMPKVSKDSAQGRSDTLDSLRLPVADLDAMGVYGFHECRKVMNSS